MCYLVCAWNGNGFVDTNEAERGRARDVGKKHIIPKFIDIFYYMYSFFLFVVVSLLLLVLRTACYLSV